MPTIAHNRISCIRVQNLFGVFNHNIPLNQKDRITIIHGPNGIGKTAVLRMTHALLRARLRTLSRIPFARLTIEFQDGRSLQAVQQPAHPRTKGPVARRSAMRACTVALHEGGKTVHTYAVSADGDSDERMRYSEALEHFFPFLDRTGANEWYDPSSGHTLTAEDVAEFYGESHPYFAEKAQRVPDWLQSLREDLPLHLIGTERLRTRMLVDEVHARRPPPAGLTVLQYSRELAEIIRSKLAESARLSTELDRTFPARLVEGTSGDVAADDDIRAKLDHLEETRSRLRRVGLVDTSEDAAFRARPSDDHTKRVLSVYVSDTEKKLAVFNELAEKLELLLAHTNGRFQYKRLALTKDGFQFLTNKDDVLSPSDLSSGEQHELVLLYELLFKVKPGSLILIDEPEISLHVAWQETFLKDLGEIIRLSDFDVLLATHSPQIISDRWDLTVELKGPDAQENGNAVASPVGVRTGE